MVKKPKKATIKIELTPEQKERIQRATGMEVSELELTPEALEERVAPGGLDTLMKLTATCTA